MGKRINGWEKTTSALISFIAENYHKLNQRDFELNSIMTSELPPEYYPHSTPMVQNVYKLNAEMIDAFTKQQMESKPLALAPTENTFEQNVTYDQPIMDATMSTWYHAQTTYSPFSIHDTQIFDNY